MIVVRTALRALVLAGVLVAAPAQAGASAWVESSIIGTRNDNSKRPNAIFLSTVTPEGPPEDTWTTIDLAEKCGLPLDSKEVFLAGLLIITHGNAVQIADLWALFRAPGDDLDPGSYQIQAIEPHLGGGVRSTVALWVPVVDGKVELYWHGAGSGVWPAESAYAINLACQAYVR